MERSDRINLLFEKYLRQKCLPHEVDELIALLQQAESEQALTAQMQKIWEELQFNKTEYEIDWSDMYQSIITNQQHADGLLKTATRKNKFPAYIIASVTLVVLITTSLYFFKKHIPPETTITQHTTAPGIKSIPKRQTIHLSDGSVVTLNASAKLNYPSAFKDKRRDVFLEGEAFFDIKHMDKKPFYVHVGNIVIKVLGTAFNIKADTLQKNVQVTVTKGKVQVIKIHLPWVYLLPASSYRFLMLHKCF